MTNGHATILHPGQVRNLPDQKQLFEEPVSFMKKHWKGFATGGILAAGGTVLLLSGALKNDDHKPGYVPVGDTTSHNQVMDNPNQYRDEALAKTGLGKNAVYLGNKQNNSYGANDFDQWINPNDYKGSDKLVNRVVDDINETNKLYAEKSHGKWIDEPFMVSEKKKLTDEEISATHIRGMRQVPGFKNMYKVIIANAKGRTYEWLITEFENGKLMSRY
ncbi:MAG: hypothetical protein NTU57_05220 [Candidatus Aenigmarchaeota archaeon]|nr:hypothetical protein [Candidatus Aenigmarchaeota archaeon]